MTLRHPVPLPTVSSTQPPARTAVSKVASSAVACILSLPAPASPAETVSSLRTRASANAAIPVIGITPCVPTGHERAPPFVTLLRPASKASSTTFAALGMVASMVATLGTGHLEAAQRPGLNASLTVGPGQAQSDTETWRVPGRCMPTLESRHAARRDAHEAAHGPSIGELHTNCEHEQAFCHHTQHSASHRPLQASLKKKMKVEAAKEKLWARG